MAKARQQWNTWRENGLYQVMTGNITAGFVVRDHQIVECAPVLRKYPGMLAIAKKIADVEA